MNGLGSLVTATVVVATCVGSVEAGGEFQEFGFRPQVALYPAVRTRVDAITFEVPIDYSTFISSHPSDFAAEEMTMLMLSAAVILKNPADTLSAAKGFTRLGFGVTTISQGVLVLTAKAEIFEAGFRTQLIVDAAGARRVSDGAETRTLPIDALPAPLRQMVAEVEFEAPPEFGPADF